MERQIELALSPGRFKEAGQVFDRMLWLNPSDNQGVRFVTGDVRAKVPWEKRSS